MESYTLSVFSINLFAIGASVAALHYDASKTVPKIISKYGYPCEIHEFLTADGYYLTAFRIPNNTKNDTGSHRFPILLVHGLMGSSADFILIGPGNALAYLLSDEGFDVWLLNCRGTRYSEKHENLNTTDSRFWDFSWHEIGMFDIPSAIDYILKETGHSKLFYLGMSQGATSFFVMLSEKPEYNEKIITHISYAPATFLCYTTNVLLRLASIPETLALYTATLSVIGPFNAGPRLPFLPIIGPILCRCGNRICPMCKHIAYMLVDIQHTHLNGSNLSLFLGHLPAGASVKSLVHYAQSIQSCQFRRYKTSIFDNPKKYNLTNIRTSLYVFYGEKDNIQHPKDIKHFQSKLRNGFKETIMVNDFGHTDFITSIDAKKRVYDKTILILKRQIKRLI